jgi:hypothetical protein
MRIRLDTECWAIGYTLSSAESLTSTPGFAGGEGVWEKRGHKRLAANVQRCLDAHCSGVSPIEMLVIYPDLMHCISR